MLRKRLQVKVVLLMAVVVVLAMVLGGDPWGPV
jgi:hypothetical protein